jgi:hypothetical protein
MAGKNDVTGDWIVSKPNSEMFEKNFDLIFKKDVPKKVAKQSALEDIENEILNKACINGNCED